MRTVPCDVHTDVVLSYVRHATQHERYQYRSNSARMAETRQTRSGDRGTCRPAHIWSARGPTGVQCVCCIATVIEGARCGHVPASQNSGINSGVNSGVNSGAHATLGALVHHARHVRHARACDHRRGVRAGLRRLSATAVRPLSAETRRGSAQVHRSCTTIAVATACVRDRPLVQYRSL